MNTRTAAFALTTAGCMAALLAQAPPRPASPQVDPVALSVVQAMDDAFDKAEGLVATYKSESFDPAGQATGSSTTELRLGRPNVYRVETTTVYRDTTSGLMLASDGTTRFTIRSRGTTPASCTTWKVAPLNEAREIDTFNPLYWSFYKLGEWQIRSALLGHWDTKWRLEDPGLRSLRYVGRDTIGGVPVDVVEWVYTVSYNRPDDDPVYTSLLSIGADHLLRRIETTSTSKAKLGMGRTVETISDIRTTTRPAKADFAYAPPDGTVCKPSDPEASYTTGRYADLPIGSKAPDFTLQTAHGETIRLSALLKQHKIVLMNYWGYG